MDTIRYGFGRTLSNKSVDEAVAQITEALGTVGFGVLTDLNVQTTIQQKLGESVRPYRILGACHPQMAVRAVRDEAHVGLLMPCNVLVQECGDGVTISAIDPAEMINWVDGAETKAILKEASQLLRQAIDYLS